MTKQLLLKYINQLPEKFTLEEVMEKILFLHKIEAGKMQSSNGETIPHNQVKDRLKKWLK